MFFAVEFQYRIALLPVPTLFITASSMTRGHAREDCMKVIFASLVPQLECAEKKYKAVFIANEPNNITHDLERAKTQDAVVACASLHFLSMSDIKSFLDTVKNGNK